jgi:AraC-like DNA-binding protein
LDGDALKEVVGRFETVGASANNKGCYAYNAKLAMAILELVMAVNEKYDFFLRGGGNKNVYAERELEFKKLASQSDRIEQIKEYVAEHIEEKLEVNEIAKEFYISSYYLSHHFKQETGFTLLDYIANQKMLAAEAMLKDGFSVTDVAGRLSYNSDSHFISAFKKMTGITPKKFAEER